MASTSQQPSGLWTLLTAAITIVTLLFGSLLIQPRLTERRLKINDRYILTPVEVEALPSGVLAAVLDRRTGEDENAFYYRLLKLALERSGSPYVLGLSAEMQPQDEAVSALVHGGDDPSRNPLRITVGVYGAGKDLNRRLQPVPIPVAGGILGLRVGWSHRNDVPLLKTVDDVADLRSILLLQGLGWSDVEIFDASGLQTYTARSENLFRLVDNRRVQLYPRGVAELEEEYQEVRSETTQTVLDPHLLIAYPFAGFFYVSPNQQALANAIRVGFERAIADGSYQRLLEESIFTPWLKKNLNLEDRSIIVLPNPNAHEALADVNPKHWIVPWGNLLNGRIERGEKLCDLTYFQKLCH